MCTQRKNRMETRETASHIRHTDLFPFLYYAGAGARAARPPPRAALPPRAPLPRLPRSPHAFARSPRAPTHLRTPSSPLEDPRGTTPGQHPGTTPPRTIDSSPPPRLGPISRALPPSPRFGPASDPSRPRRISSPSRSRISPPDRRDGSLVIHGGSDARRPKTPRWSPAARQPVNV